MSADRLPCLASFLKSFHSVSCYRATAHGRNLFCTGGMCAGNSASAFLPSFLSPCRPAAPPPQTPARAQCARFSTASSASLRYAGTAVQDVKRTNGGAIERADILLLQTGRIAPSRTPRVLRPKNLADATTDKAKHQCSVQLFIRWLSSLPPNCNS